MSFSKIVTDGTETWLETRTFSGFSKAEAKRLWKKHLKNNDWRVV